MREILRIHVLCTHSELVRGGQADAAMVFFEGEADSPYFRGRVLPGGCDTQRKAGERFRLSARYILEGTDAEGRPCRIFVENNGEASEPPADGVLHTRPLVLTDSPALQWLERASLRGTVTGEGENRVLIQIYAEDEA